MQGWEFWICAVAATIFVGMGKGGLPVVGTLSVPVLALVISPVTAAGLLLPVYILSDMFGLWAYRREFNGRVLAIMLPGASLGVLIGWATATIVPEAAVELIVGLVGAAFAANLIFRPRLGGAREAKIGPGLFWGTAAGFTSFVSHSGGPPYQVYTLPLGMTKTVFAGTSTIAFAFINLIKLPPYWALGQVNVANLKIAAILMPLAVGAVFVGVWLVKVLPEKLFFQIVTWALLLLSVKLISDGLQGLLG
jgi:uncharacterized protein